MDNGKGFLLYSGNQWLERRSLALHGVFDTQHLEEALQQLLLDGEINEEGLESLREYRQGELIHGGMLMIEQWHYNQLDF